MFVAMALAVAMSAQGATYAEAYNAADGGDVAVVILSASWCGPCQRLKAGLAGADFPVAVVDVEREPRLARLLMPGNSVPRVIVFRRIGGRWFQIRRTGPNAATVRRDVGALREYKSGG